MKQRRQASRTLVLALSLGIGIPVLVLIVIIVGAVYLLGGFRDNIANDQLSGLTKTLTAAGGRVTCQQGDAGYGPDNTEPWQQVDIYVPDATRAEAAFRAAAAAHGYHLVVDPSVTDAPSGEKFYTSDPGSTGTGLSYVVARNEKFGSACSNTDERQTVSGKAAIFEVELVDPSRS